MSSLTRTESHTSVDGKWEGSSQSSSESPFDLEAWRLAESHSQDLIESIQPTEKSEERRAAVSEYIKKQIRKCFDCKVFTFGSVPLKTYLPHGDIDLTLFSDCGGLKDSWAGSVHEILIQEENNSNADFKVEESQYIQAEVKIIKCLVEGVVVDISFNQLGGLCTLCFLEDVDSLIGRNHLFKRSIILIKAWCFYESRILGAHHGLISTYGLETLVLYIFQLFHKELNGPLQVLLKFLTFFSGFNWTKYCVSLHGPVFVSGLPNLTVDHSQVSREDFLLTESFLSQCKAKYGETERMSNGMKKAFVPKHLNIVDYRLESNNLGRSVSKGNFTRIRSAFSYGAKKLIEAMKDTNPLPLLDKFFKNTMEVALQDCRPDCCQRQKISHLDFTALNHPNPSLSDLTLENEVPVPSVFLGIPQTNPYAASLISAGWRPELAAMIVAESIYLGCDPLSLVQSKSAQMTAEFHYQMSQLANATSMGQEQSQSGPAAQEKSDSANGNEEGSDPSVQESAEESSAVIETVDDVSSQPSSLSQDLHIPEQFLSPPAYPFHVGFPPPFLSPPFLPLVYHPGQGLPSPVEPLHRQQPYLAPPNVVTARKDESTLNSSERKIAADLPRKQRPGTGVLIPDARNYVNRRHVSPRKQATYYASTSPYFPFTCPNQSSTGFYHGMLGNNGRQNGEEEEFAAGCSKAVGEEAESESSSGGADDKYCERRKDILDGNSEQHWQNLKFGKFCRESLSRYDNSQASNSQFYYHQYREGASAPSQNRLGGWDQRRGSSWAGERSGGNYFHGGGSSFNQGYNPNSYQNRRYQSRQPSYGYDQNSGRRNQPYYQSNNDTYSSKLQFPPREVSEQKEEQTIEEGSVSFEAKNEEKMSDKSSERDAAGQGASSEWNAELTAKTLKSTTPSIGLTHGPFGLAVRKPDLHRQTYRSLSNNHYMDPSVDGAASFGLTGNLRLAKKDKERQKLERREGSGTSLGTPLGTPTGTPAETPVVTPVGTPGGTPAGTPGGRAEAHSEHLFSITKVLPVVQFEGRSDSILGTPKSVALPSPGTDPLKGNGKFSHTKEGLVAAVVRFDGRRNGSLSPSKGDVSGKVKQNSEEKVVGSAETASSIRQHVESGPTVQRALPRGQSLKESAVASNLKVEGKPARTVSGSESSSSHWLSEAEFPPLS